MSYGMATTLRAARQQEVVDAIDAGASNGTVTIYNGTQPSNGGAATTALVVIDLNDPCGVVSGATLTWSVGTLPTGIGVAAGTGTWARFEDSDSNFVMDCTVGEGTGDLQLDNTDIAIGQVVNIIGGTLVEANAGVA